MLKGPYLRVLTPATDNGVNLVYTPDGKVKYRESHLHISALKRMERKNLQRPQHLKHIIEVVSDDQKPPEVPIQRPAPAAQAQKPAARVRAQQESNSQEEATNGQETHEAPRQEPKKVVKRRTRKPAKK